MTQKLTGGEAIVHSLLLHGEDTMFGIPEVQTYGLFDVLHQVRNRLRLIYARHEQATAYMAVGLLKATGRRRVFSVAPRSPGLNARAAKRSANGASTPVFCVTGQSPSDFIGSGKGHHHLHALPDQLGTRRAIMKRVSRIDHTAEAPPRLPKRFVAAIERILWLPEIMMAARFLLSLFTRFPSPFNQLHRPRNSK